ncbi:MAG TPA: diheme cytochrome c-553 [Candidatus Krumholzibacteria bacterium]|nr:diheme cytochrome c-553 [Candidatus Krumholzibacteria bacterium]
MRTLARIAFVCISIVTVAAGVPRAADKPSADLVARGKYLVNLGGCNDCHSPKLFTEKGPEPDPARLLSGHPAGSPVPEVDARAFAPGYWVLMGPDFTVWVGPWGTSYTANLTPDDQTGIGLWTEDIFIKAMHTGLHMGAGRPIMPPMPWQNLAMVNDEDLKAIFAYLKSLPPIKNAVPAPTPPAAAAGGSK